jgi:hypothetical protein
MIGFVRVGFNLAWFRGFALEGVLLMDSDGFVPDFYESC